MEFSNYNLTGNLRIKICIIQDYFEFVKLHQQKVKKNAFHLEIDCHLIQ